MGYPMAKKEGVELFRLAARREFAFLVGEFGFTEERLPKGKNEFAVWLANDTTRVVIESINYGLHARVALGKAASKDTFENYDLGDLVKICCTELETRSALSEAGALGELPRLADLLRQVGSPVLRGDFHLFPSIQARVDQRLAEWRAQQGKT